MQQKITPNLWFDGAKEAVDFYVSVFPDSEIVATTYYPGSAEEGLADFQRDFAGQELTVDFRISDMQFTAINGGPEFKFNPSVSFLLNFDPSKDAQAQEHLDELWEKLKDGGEVLMPLDKYPFSQHYGWCKDKYGLTWQLSLSEPGDEWRPFITPSLMFGQDHTNHAEEAASFYVSVFKDSKLGELFRYTEDTGPSKKGSLMFGDLMLSNQWFAVNDAAEEADYTFNEAVSFSVSCKDQAEIDYFWEKLSAVPESEVCGWCKDKYGVSWQIIPENIDELTKKPGGFTKLMQMKKIVVADF